MVDPFWPGALGSFAVELAIVAKVYYTEPIRIPDRMKRWDWYLIRVLLVLVGGGLAHFYGLQNAIASVNVGAAAPAIITSLSRGASTQVRRRP